jgi:hypothetical protein
MIDLSWLAGRGAARRKPSKSDTVDEPWPGSITAATVGSVIDGKFMRRQPKFTNGTQTVRHLTSRKAFPWQKSALKGKYSA